ncbi:hypothetical protein ACJX0J_021644, partial [Zea mays]
SIFTTILRSPLMWGPMGGAVGKTYLLYEQTHRHAAFLLICRDKEKTSPIGQSASLARADFAPKTRLMHLFISSGVIDVSGRSSLKKLAVRRRLEPGTVFFDILPFFRVQ